MRRPWRHLIGIDPVSAENLDEVYTMGVGALCGAFCVSADQLTMPGTQLDCPGCLDVIKRLDATGHVLSEYLSTIWDECLEHVL